MTTPTRKPNRHKLRHPNELTHEAVEYIWTQYKANQALLADPYTKHRFNKHLIAELAAHLQVGIQAVYNVINLTSHVAVSQAILAK
jgi:Mor family transcriptional regulator